MTGWSFHARNAGMNYNSSKTTFPASGDPLTDMLRGLRL
ncbi:MAG: AraC family transcriptional regulator, partial [Mesorhizobium sp.]